MTAASEAAGPSESVPGNPLRSPVEPYGNAGATT
jgi:hypothetical protein